MSDNNKLIPAYKVAQAVLTKVKEMLSESSLAKAEKLSKYETEMKAAPAKPKPDTAKKLERDYNDFETKKQNDNSKDNRQAKQISPSKNPKEEAEGNNKPDGMEPSYEFKDKVKGELAKEKTMLGKNEKLAKKYEGFKEVKESAKESGASDPGAVAAAIGRKKYGKEVFQHAAAAGKKMGKAENTDKEADAKLGEKVEKEVEQHFKENKDAEEKEGHKLMTKSHGDSKFKRCTEDVKENSPEVTSPAAVCVAEGVKPAQQKAESSTEHAVIPRLIGSAKLSKFMEYRHAKKKAMETAAAGKPDTSNPTEKPPVTSEKADG